MKRTASDRSFVYVIYRPFRKSIVCIINVRIIEVYETIYLYMSSVVL